MEEVKLADHEAVEMSSIVGDHMLSGCDYGDVTVVEAYSGLGNSDVCNRIRFKLGDWVYVCIENPDDGYRSCMRELYRIPFAKSGMTNVFESMPVEIEYIENRGGASVEIIEIRYRKLLVIQAGTDRSDDYYPSFVGLFQPEALGETKPLKPKKVGRAKYKHKVLDVEGWGAW